MKEEKQRDLLGIISIVLGGVFVIAGIVLFFMSNYMNFQLQKTEATVIGMYDITLESGLKHTMVELSYRVGDELMLTSYEYPGKLDEETLVLEVYYNIKEPGMVVDVGWSFEPLLVLALGVLMLIPGLYMKGILKSDLISGSATSITSGKMTKEFYDARSRTLEGLLPMVAGVLFTAFGIFMLIKDMGWWAWLFIIVGIIELLYIGMDFIPALITWIQITKVNKVAGKVKVYDVETDGELKAQSEDKKEESKDTKDEKKTATPSAKEVPAKKVNTKNKKKKSNQGKKKR